MAGGHRRGAQRQPDHRLEGADRDTDPDRNRLTVLDPATGQVRNLGKEGAEPGQFRVPTGIATGPDGRLYVLDSDNGRVQVFSSLDAK